MTAALIAAIRGMPFTADAPVTDELRRAVGDAAGEARQRELRPEELLLVFKKIEQRLEDGMTIAESAAYRTRRSQVVRVLLEAYYSE